MACRQILCLQRQRVLLQEVEANVPVAFDAGIRRDALPVLVDEILDNRAAKHVFRVQHVERNLQLVGNPARVGHLVGCAAAVKRAPTDAFFRQQRHDRYRTGSF